jgi:hypothetical protein
VQQPLFAALRWYASEYLGSGENLDVVQPASIIAIH